MLRRFICALAALLLVIPGVSAGGVSEVGKDRPKTKIEIKTQGDELVYELSGDIEPGAEDLFNELAGKNPQGGWLVLSSLGGDVRAAIMIGLAAQRQKIKTYVPPNTYCLSACAIIWAGGYERWAAKGATLGFHRPWRMVNGKPEDGDVEPLVVYFEGLGFSKVVIERFLWPANTFYYLDGESAEILGIKAKFED